MPRSKKQSNKPAQAQPPAGAPVQASEAPQAPAPQPPVSIATPALTTSSAKPDNPPRERIVSGMAIPILILAIILTAAGLGYRMYSQRNQAVPGENEYIIKQVAKLAVVPKDEVPSVTTVVDITKVNQEFLRTARKGDKVLLYFQEGRAVVYRPSTRQIVNMGPLETPKPRVFLRDGTGSSNMTAVTDKVTGTNEFLYASRDISPVKNYEKTVVVDLTGNRPDVAQRLARLLGVTVVKLPEGEAKPDGDMLVIVGKDQAAQAVQADGQTSGEDGQAPTPAADQPVTDGTPQP